MHNPVLAAISQLPPSPRLGSKKQRVGLIVQARHATIARHKAVETTSRFTLSATYHAVSSMTYDGVPEHDVLLPSLRDLLSGRSRSSAIVSHLAFDFGGGRSKARRTVGAAGKSPAGAERSSLSDRRMVCMRSSCGRERTNAARVGTLQCTEICCVAAVHSGMLFLKSAANIILLKSCSTFLCFPIDKPDV
jgi:hypothetical protein